MTRRELGQASISLALALGGVGAAAGRARASDEALVTEFPENAALIAAIAYVNESAVPDQNCANCALYLGGDAPRGRCGLFQKGVVPAAGYCASWSKKSG